MKETELVARLVENLREDGWDVFQEVEGSHGDNRADIVAVKGDTVRIMEAKMSLSLALLAQLDHWCMTSEAHEVWAVVPAMKRRPFRGEQPARIYARHLCEKMGAGVMEHSLAENQWQEEGFITRVKPRRFELGPSPISNKLDPEMRGIEGGGNRGGQWTKFKATCARVREHLSSNPNSTMRDIVAGIDHHYATDASARNCLRNMIEVGNIAGVGFSGSGKARTYSLLDVSVSEESEITPSDFQPVDDNDG